MRAGWNSAVIVAVAGVGAGLAGICASARADVVVSHLPIQSGGGVDDTAFLYYGTPFWNLDADDFVLDQPATIRRVSWWSFYGGNDDTQVEPPPPTQTIRVRLYEPRLSDGLPGSVLFEEFFVDPWREYAGFEVLVGAHPPAFRYQADLSTPWSLASGTTYWLSVAQIGDYTSLYRWVFGVPDGTAFVYMNPLTGGEWRPFAGVSNLAFQLSMVPEMHSSALLGPAILISQFRTRRRS